jgi:calcium-dependent protein kinase
VNGVISSSKADSLTGVNFKTGSREDKQPIIKTIIPIYYDLIILEKFSKFIFNTIMGCCTSNILNEIEARQEAATPLPYEIVELTEVNEFEIPAEYASSSVPASQSLAVALPPCTETEYCTSASRKARSGKRKKKKPIGVKCFIQVSTKELKDSYKLLSKLATGSSGVVYRAIHKDLKIERAVKTILTKNYSKHDLNCLFKEISIHESLDHPNILKVIEVIQSPNTVHIVSELCMGGELFDRIISVNSFSEARAACYIRQILSAVLYCHNKGIIHGNLKPENILLQQSKPDSTVKIMGLKLGHLEYKNIERRTSEIYYTAPEVLDGRITFKSDIWSCGVILYILLCGYPPFNGRNNIEIAEKIRSGIFEFTGKEWYKISSEAKQIIMSMMVVDPIQRTNAQDVLSHPWFQTKLKVRMSKRIASTSLRNLSRFRANFKLQQAVLEFIASQMTSDKETKYLSTLFSSLDADGDGRLSKQEILNGIKQNKMIPKKEMNRILDNCDINGDGFIEYTEFITATLNWKKALSEDKLTAVFKAFDTDNSGTISLSELKNLIGGDSSGAWEELLKEADRDGDGMVRDI